MSAAKHTPGPWSVGRAGPNKCPTVGDDHWLMVAMVVYGEPPHPTAANAKLIAAAPELADALEAILDRCTDGRNEADGASLAEWADEIRAALRKAGVLP